MKWVKEKMPWNFGGGLLILEEWPKSGKWQDAKLDGVPCWIRMRGFPWKVLNLTNARKMGGLAGEILDLRWKDGARNLLHNYARVRIKFPINKSIFVGKYILVEGKKEWVQFKFERLPLLCFKCGIWGHDRSECNEPSVKVENIDGKLYDLYGGWLKEADSRENCFSINSSAEEDGSKEQVLETRGMLNANKGDVVRKENQIKEKSKGNLVFTGESQLTEENTKNQIVKTKDNNMRVMDAEMIAGSVQSGGLDKIFNCQERESFGEEEVLNNVAEQNRENIMPEKVETSSTSKGSEGKKRKGVVNTEESKDQPNKEDHELKKKIKSKFEDAGQSNKEDQNKSEEHAFVIGKHDPILQQKCNISIKKMARGRMQSLARKERDGSKHQHASEGNKQMELVIYPVDDNSYTGVDFSKELDGSSPLSEIVSASLASQGRREP